MKTRLGISPIVFIVSMTSTLKIWWNLNQKAFNDVYVVYNYKDHFFKVTISKKKITLKNVRKKRIKPTWVIIIGNYDYPNM